jgi:hypothetical protein
MIVEKSCQIPVVMLSQSLMLVKVEKLWLMLDDDAEDNDGADNNIDVLAMMIDNQLMICNDDDYVLNC